MKQMKVAQISKAGGDFELVQQDIPEPRQGEVRIKVGACGVCHSDMFAPRISYDAQNLNKGPFSP